MRKLLLLSIILCSITSFGQKKVSVNVKVLSKKLKIYNLPELHTDKEHLTYSADFKDVKGKEYSFGLGNFDVPATDYIRNYRIDGSDYAISVNQLSISKSAKVKRLQKKTYTKKLADGSYASYVLYSYQLLYNSNVHLRIIDNLDDSKVVFDEKINFESASVFPVDFGSSKGYTSEAILKRQYKDFVLKKTNATEELAKTKATYRCFRISVKDKLNNLLTNKVSKYIVALSKFKVKDKRFKSLDSSEIYFKEAIAVLKEQETNTSITNTNMHSEKAYKAFNNMYLINKKYASSEYYDLITDSEEKASFISGLRLNLFFAAIMTSRYEEAHVLFKEGYSAKKLSEQAQKKEKGLKAQTIGLMQYTIENKDYSAMEILIPILNKEELIYESQKIYYKFYK